jgi:hypothetical protein
MPHKYTDEQGAVVLSVSSTIPGLTFIPPGFQVSDATGMTHEEFKQAMDEAAAIPEPTLAELTARMVQLQADIEKLKVNRG